MSATLAAQFNELDADKLIPDGWASIPVKELLQLQNGFPFKPAQWSKKGRPIIRIQNLNRPDASFNYFEGELDQRFLVRKGDLLFAWSGTPGTSFGAHIWSGEDAWLNQHIFNVKFKRLGLNKEFIRLAINQNLSEYVEKANGGVGLAHITKAKFDESRLLIPPPDVQATIVDKVQEALGRLTPVRERLAQTQTVLTRFRQSVLAEACSGQLTSDWRGTDELQNWEARAAQEVCAKVQSGSTPKEGFTSSPGVPFLKVYNLVDQRINFDYKPQFVSAQVFASRSMSRSTAIPGDVLMNIVGPPLGKVAVVTEQFPEWTFNQALTAFRPSKSITTEWLYLILCSGIPYEEILMQTRGSAGQSNISLTQCREMVLPIPPVNEQLEIVRQVESLFALADSIESRLVEATAQVERTAKAILAKAFRGELT